MKEWEKLKRISQLLSAPPFTKSSLFPTSITLEGVGVASLMCRRVHCDSACLFIWLAGRLSIRQTRSMLLFCRGRRRVPLELLVRCSCMCVVLQGSARLVGGRMVILSPQMDRKSPGGIWKATGNVVCILCVRVCSRVWHLCVAFWRSCATMCVRHNSVADRSSTTPLSCNKCHPCLLGLPSKSPDQSHTHTHTQGHTHLYTHTHTHTHTHNMATQRQISLGPDYIREGQFSITWTNGLFISTGGKRHCPAERHTRWKKQTGLLECCCHRNDGGAKWDINDMPCGKSRGGRGVGSLLLILKQASRRKTNVSSVIFCSSMTLPTH